MGMVIFFLLKSQTSGLKCSYHFSSLSWLKDPRALVIIDSCKRITSTGLSLEVKLDSACVQQKIRLTVGGHPCLTSKISFLRYMELNFLWKSPPKELQSHPWCLLPYFLRPDLACLNSLSLHLSFLLAGSQLACPCSFAECVLSCYLHPSQNILPVKPNLAPCIELCLAPRPDILPSWAFSRVFPFFPNLENTAR